MMVTWQLAIWYGVMMRAMCFEFGGWEPWGESVKKAAD